MKIDGLPVKDVDELIGLVLFSLGLPILRIAPADVADYYATLGGRPGATIAREGYDVVLTLEGTGQRLERERDGG